MEYLFLIIGFVILTVAADWLVNGASGLAKRLNVSNLVIGLTVVAFGTSAPELVVNLVAAINNTNEIAMTNILGSNTINTLVILGLTALVYPVACKKTTYMIEIPMSFLAGFMVLFLGTDIFGYAQTDFRGLSRTDATILLILFVVFLLYTIYNSKKYPCGEHEEFLPIPIWKACVLILIGLIGLVAGGNLIVKNAVTIAESWGVSEAIIGVTIVALGTSLPELATSVVAAFKHNTDLAIGNVIGSNIFNVFFVLGVSSMIRPLEGYDNLVIDSIMAAMSSLILLPLILIDKERKLNRWSGIIMLILYAIYLWWILQ